MLVRMQQNGHLIKRELNNDATCFEDSVALGIKIIFCARFGSTYTEIGTIQRRLAWPLRKDDTQIREAFHILKKIVTVDLDL